MKFKVLIATTLISSISLAQVYSLNDFLNDVKKGNINYKSYEDLIRINKDKFEEKDILTMPNFFAEGKIAKDKSGTYVGPMPTTSLFAKTLAFGLMGQTDFGLSAKLKYEIDKTEVEGIPKQYLPLPEFYSGKPTLELKQNITKNGFGREVRITKGLMENNQKLQATINSFKQKALLVEAEIAYWQLSKTRELIELQKESLKSSKRILEWATKRVKMELTEKTEQLQAEAGVSLREFELKSLENEEVILERKLNTIRGNVEEKSEISELEKAANFDIPKNFIKLEHKEDVEAEIYINALSDLNLELAKEKYMPEIYAFGSMSLTGSDNKFGQTVSNSFKTNKPIYAVGLNVTIPIDVPKLFRVWDTYDNEKIALKTQLDRKFYEEKRNWEELKQNLENSKSLLAASRRMEKIQKEKLESEKKQLFNAKTTTFQVLLSEQDLIQAELGRVKIELQILAILAQIKLFAKA